MKISFKLNNASTTLGEQIFIVGNQTNLGNWSLDKAKQMETNSSIHPAWISSSSATIQTKMESYSIEYKYINCQVDHFKQKQKVTWESGGNRHLDLSMFYDKNSPDYELLIEDPGFNMGKSDRPVVHEYYRNAFEQSYISKDITQNNEWDKIRLGDDTSEFLTDFYEKDESRANGDHYFFNNKERQHRTPDDSMAAHSMVEVQVEKINWEPRAIQDRNVIGTIESQISDISTNMANLYKQPQGKHYRGKNIGRSSDNLSTMNKSEGLSVSRDLSQINKQQPSQQLQDLGYNLNHNDTANFNIEQEDEDYIREIMQDMKEVQKSNRHQRGSTQATVHNSQRKRAENRYFNQFDENYDTDEAINPIVSVDNKDNNNLQTPKQGIIQHMQYENAITNFEQQNTQKTVKGELKTWQQPTSPKQIMEKHQSKKSVGNGLIQTNHLNGVESVQTFAKKTSDHSFPEFEINLVNKDQNINNRESSSVNSSTKKIQTSSKKKLGNTTRFQLDADGSVRESGSQRPSISMRSFMKNAESKSIVSKKSGRNVVASSKEIIKSQESSNFSGITLESMTGPSCRIDEIDDLGQTTVGLLKDAVCHCLNLPDWLQRAHVQLYSGGYLLADDESILEDHAIEQGSTINYVVMIA